MKNVIIAIPILFLSCFTLLAQTNVSGGIYTNTIWAVGGSPYIVTDTLTLFPGVTLTINPGVVVKFENDKLFDVRGTLNAIGTVSDSIVFTSNSVTPNQQSWAGLIANTNVGGILNLKYARIMYAYIAYRISFGGYGPLNISNTVFENNFIGIAGYTYPSAIIDIDSCLWLCCVNRTY